MHDRYKEWLMPTLAGLIVATLRRFRRQEKERWIVVLGRFAAHASTCVIAGYIVAGVLSYFDLPKLIAPLCALAGLYGTMLVNWLEEEGIGLLTEAINHYVLKK